ncbi:unnamed protein product, partial [Owenia fusiformis]
NRPLHKAQNFKESLELMLLIEAIFHKNTTNFQDIRRAWTGRKRQSLALVKPTGVSALCWEHWKQRKSGLELFNIQPWALLMDDARGKVSPGLFEGNLHFVGNYDECLRITANLTEYDDTIPEENASFDGRYCTVETTVDISLMDIGIPIDVQPVFWIGECVPSTCNASDIDLLLQSDLQQSDDILDFVLAEILQFRSACHDVPHISADPGAMGVLIFILILVFFAIIGTIVDEVKIMRKSCCSMDDQNTKNYTGGGLDNIGFSDTKNFAKLPPCPDGSLTDSTFVSKSILIQNEKLVPSGRCSKVSELVLRMLCSFSIRRNIRHIFADVNEQGVPQCVNGARVLSMAWLILGLMHILGVLYSEKFTTRRGVLVSIIFLRFLEKHSGSWTISKSISHGVYFIVHRWWRLTPLYFLLLMCFAYLFDYIGNGPLWPEPDDTDRQRCSENIWANLLYVSNLYRPKDACMAFSFPMACGMQFYIVSPLLLIPLYYSPILGSALLLLCLAGNLSALAIINTKLETRNETSILEFANDYFHEVIITPWCRIGPHLVGLACGYIIQKFENHKLSFKGKMIIIPTAWIIALLCITLVTFGSYSQYGEYGQPWSTTTNIIYETLSALVWSIGVGWIVVACALGYGGVINSILSWKAWVPLSRVSFAAHLTYPLVLLTYNLNRRSLLYLSDRNIAYWFLGHFSLTYAIALGLTLLIEVPTRELEKAIYQFVKTSEDVSQKSKESSSQDKTNSDGHVIQEAQNHGNNIKKDKHRVVSEFMNTTL